MFPPDSPSSFGLFFYHRFAEFFSFAEYLLHDPRSAKNVTADAFFQLWSKIADFSDEASVKAYLYAAIRDNSLAYLKTRSANPSPNYYTLDAESVSALPPALLRDILGFVERFELPR
ncbi:MAG: sigma factor [Bacteroidota bacterium]|nr:sigma factor [Bacteroidota bacterium]MDP4215287.1 sigma factor [Bacteroidota bacterium]MDP4245894.1 sigma factor [Bacteroidota bacterium]MDP4254287.1 sigma factor [Bacteroidota bacterium]MDP4259224.1 sigma factor [Bacteroidota bacterium]